MSEGELADLWTRDFEEGIEGSDVRPGFIKIAVGPDDTLSKEHVKIVAAAALTHNRTGLVIASHTGPDLPAFRQLEIIQSYGVLPSSFIWVHAQRGTLEGNLKAARKGAWISLDNVNDQVKDGERFSIGWYADRILAIKKAGYLKKVLISHDAGWYSPGEEEGGDFRGYTAIFGSLVPALKERGFSEDEIRLLLANNPQEAFRLRKPL
jgi:phosphotriesterase-related protein